jgi:hypothetical protein
MPTYAIKDASGNVVQIADAPTKATARSGAAAMLFDIDIATTQEILSWGSAQREIAVFEPATKKESPKDPNQTDLVEEIARAAESGDISHASLTDYEPEHAPA